MSTADETFEDLDTAEGLDLDELKRLHDKAYQAGQITREQAADDSVFYWASQWDEGLIEGSDLNYQGQFDVTRKAVRHVLTQLASNPVQVNFDPRLDEREDAAEILDGLYRADDRLNTSIEAYEMGAQESVVAGFGAWEMYTEYLSNRGSDPRQVIRRRWIPEAFNTVFWDPNAKNLDKSDAKYVSKLTAYSENGYRELVKDLTGEDPGPVPDTSFKAPEESYAFPWMGGEAKKIYITNFYQCTTEKDTILMMEDPFGQTIEVYQSTLKDVEDDMLEGGFTIVGEKEVNRTVITKYVASGDDILSCDRIAGEYLPIIPIYGERSIVEGEETYEGIVRLAKDPQRLRNFQMSYLADIVSRSPRPKPIFTAEQIQGFEDMYDISGAENNYPYLLQNSVNAAGEEVPLGPAGLMPEQTVPQALMLSMELTRQAVEDVANPGVPQDVADPDLSGKAVLALQNRVDQQTYIYQHHMKFAKRRDGEVYASMAAEVYDVPREVTIAKPDGQTQKVEVMQSVYDQETGEMTVVNDLRGVEFDVFADIGPQYNTQKEATIDQLGEMAAAVAQTDPMLHKAIILKQLELMDGVNMDDIREYAHRQLIATGFKDPESEEDEAILQQAQQEAQEPEPEMVLAQGEAMKGQAMMAREEREARADEADARNDHANTQINAFKAETERMGTLIDAESAKASQSTDQMNSFTKRIETMAKIQDNRLEQFAKMTDDELFEIASGKNKTQTRPQQGA